jgi:hypothetical protein
MWVLIEIVLKTSKTIMFKLNSELMFNLTLNDECRLISVNCTCFCYDLTYKQKLYIPETFKICVDPLFPRN